jgi:hypothetical protein
MNETIELPVSCLDVEVGLLKHFNFRQNIIVTNVTDASFLVPFETDMVVLTKSGFAYGIEIKVSKSDLKADLKKRQFTSFDTAREGKKGVDRWYSRFKYFYYAVPSHLVEDAKSLVPPFCGVLSIRKLKYPESWLPELIYYKVTEERSAERIPSERWTDEQKMKLAHLGAMRIYSLKNRQIQLQTRTNPQ